MFLLFLLARLVMRLCSFVCADSELSYDSGFHWGKGLTDRLANQ